MHLQKIITRILKGYHHVSVQLWSTTPLFAGSGCRFEPTCSHYGLLAVEKHGIVKGVVKSVGRLLRCNPFSTPRVDMP